MCSCANVNYFSRGEPWRVLDERVGVVLEECMSGLLCGHVIVSPGHWDYVVQRGRV